jgi:DNA mismatch repair protein MSH3
MISFRQMAIADAVLHHLVEHVKCKTLFITHYPLVATELERKFPEEVQNLHMSYITETRINGTRDVSFLYQLIPGIAFESFGVECGRLAGLPDDILRIASERSELCRTVTEQRTRRSRSVLGSTSTTSFQLNDFIGRIDSCVLSLVRFRRKMQMNWKNSELQCGSL